MDESKKPDLIKTKPTRLFIAGKCSDMCTVDITDQNGNTIFEHNGYVPPITTDCGEDYIRFEIDCKTGKIIDWDYDKFIQNLQCWIEEN